MGFRTKLDYSDNRQIKQHIETFTALSGATGFGVPFYYLPSGPNMDTTGITEDFAAVASTFFSDGITNTWTWYDARMEAAASQFSAITDANSAVTQFAIAFSPSSLTNIDGHNVALAWTGVSFDIEVIAIFDLGGGNFSGTVQSEDVFFYSAGTLDFTGRTIWVDVSGITRTENLIVTSGASTGFVLTCANAEGLVQWAPVSGATSGTTIWILGDVLSTAVLAGSGGQAVNAGDVSEGTNTIASGGNSHAEGDTTVAAGLASHAEGAGTLAFGVASHAEGSGSIASGSSAHAEGNATTAYTTYSHTEGYATYAGDAAFGPIPLIIGAGGVAAHAEGLGSVAYGDGAHGEGRFSRAFGYYSHAEGSGSTAAGIASHSEGQTTIANQTASHAEGKSSIAFGTYSHAEGELTIANGIAAHSEGSATLANEDYTHAEGYRTSATTAGSHAEGQLTLASGARGSHSEGYNTRATASNAHSEGINTIASGPYSHAEGSGCVASGSSAHAEGDTTIAGGNMSHAEGSGTTAEGFNTHAEGFHTLAGGDYSHAAGYRTITSGNSSYAGGSNSFALGDYSFVHGLSSKASATNTVVLGASITGTSANTTYVDNLNVKNFAGGPFVNNLGIDANGNIVTGVVVSGGQGTFSGGVVTGGANFIGGVSANTIVVNAITANTYTNLPFWSAGTGTNALATKFGTNVASGDFSFAIGQRTTATTDFAYAEGTLTYAAGLASHAEGIASSATGVNSHAEGAATLASGNRSHTEGNGTWAIGVNSHAEGTATRATGDNGAHAEGSSTSATTDAAHSEGDSTQANGVASHAEGWFTRATSIIGSRGAHAEGSFSFASGNAAHAEGVSTSALTDASHSEGSATTASGLASHAGGVNSRAIGTASFVHGSGSTAIGNNTIVLGVGISGLSGNTTYVENLRIKSGDTLTIGNTKLDEASLAITEASLSTGLYVFSNSGITVSAATATTFNVGAVRGWIVDSADVLNANPIFVSYNGVTGATTPFLLTNPASYLMITSASTLSILNTRPSASQRRQNIFLGALGHTNNVIDSAGNEPDLLMNEMSQIRAMFEPISLINSGVIPYPNGVNLALANTAGNLYGLGIGFIANGNLSPTVIAVTAGAPTTFQYRTQTSGAFGNTSLIDPTNYDNAGVLTSVPGSNNNATNQRVYLLIDGSIRVQYGQTVYGTISAAIEAATNESFVVYPNNLNLGLLIGIISIRKGASNLSNTGDAQFLPVSKFGETVGAAGGISTTTLQSAYNNSGLPEIVTNSTLLGVSIKRGSASDTDVILEGGNGAGLRTFTVDGNGKVSATTYVGGSAIASNSSFGFVHGRNSSAGTANDIIVLGPNLTGGTSGYTYVNALNIKQVGAGPGTIDIGVDANGNVVNQASDISMKENISTIENALDKVKNLRGVTYQWKDRNAGGDALRIGFVAQEVYQVEPLLVTNLGGGILGVQYKDVTALLVEAVKELANGTIITGNTYLETQTIIAEDNNIQLNYNGSEATAIGGGLEVLHAKGNGFSAELNIDANGDWVTNNDFKPFGLTIPYYSPTSSGDISGNEGNITRDDEYLYVKTSTGWKRTNLENF